MAVNQVAMQAYQRAAQFKNQFNEQVAQRTTSEQKQQGNGFVDAISGSLKKVNDSKQEANAMIESFASGKTQNVHELMISMQKASVAMNMTTAVRSKVMQAYKKIMQMHV
jgi:flagellar hook-basal body complex protein FliE